VDKPAGLTSHDVVQRVRRAVASRAVGHTGTLDPFATGLLVLMVGRATRLARFVEAQPKTYVATARLGARTDTDDLTGRVLGETRTDVAIPEHELRSVLDGFLGDQVQRPPAYSAKRIQGNRSYLLARLGRTVEPRDVQVRVHEIELVTYRPPDVTFRAVVSAGTYLRAIARDLGERLGVGAHLVALRREAIGELRVDAAVPLREVTADALRPVRTVLGHLPVHELDEAGRIAVSHGRPLPDEGAPSGDVALVAGDELVAVARAAGDGWLRPSVVLGPA
jgi:tRNA pseudouridine55 synthase